MHETVKDPPGRVACLGEPLVLVAGPDRHLGGAEANVAAGLVAAGIPAAFVGRVGNDAYGALIHTELSARGVDVSAVEIDDARPTGYYSKTTDRDASGEVHTVSSYSRAGSAASAMTPEFLESKAVAAIFESATVVHCSGINPALSDTCHTMMTHLLADRPGISAMVTFDVNWREPLWPDGDPRIVVELANQADVVLVGADEAVRVMDTDDPVKLRRILPDPQTLIIKDGAHRALAVDRDGGIVEVPALSVTVVEPVGAGDAFAAGYLSGVVRGEATTTCLRRGHIGAAAVLTIAADSAPPPPAETLQQLLTCTDRQWAATTVTAAGFSIPDES